VPEFRIASTRDVPPGKGHTIRVDGRQIALFNVKGRFYAIDDACPHMRADLSGGEVGDGTVTCSWHGWQFDLVTGKCLTVTRAEVRCYTLRIAGEDIHLTLEPDPTPEEEPQEEFPEIVWKNPQS
jgi:nitrite reductase/ring-hydroxylating ferredoxin subunit